MSKIWFVTGSSRGLGRSFVEAALSRGDKVAATARNPDRLDELVTTYGDAVLPIALDVTDKAAVFDSLKRAKDHFGHTQLRRKMVGRADRRAGTVSGSRDAREEVGPMNAVSNGRSPSSFTAWRLT